MNYKYFVCITMLLCLVFFAFLFMKKLKISKETFVEKKNETILFFYANWCPHCTSFKPEVVQFKNKQEQMKKPVNVQLLEEASCPKELMQKHNIRGFPTVIYTNKDKVIEYINKLEPSILMYALNYDLREILDKN